MNNVKEKVIENKDSIILGSTSMSNCIENLGIEFSTNIRSHILLVIKIIFRDLLPLSIRKHFPRIDMNEQ